MIQKYRAGDLVSLSERGRRAKETAKKSRTIAVVLNKSKFPNCYRVEWKELSTPEVLHEDFLEPITDPSASRDITLIEELRLIYKLRGDTYSSAEVCGACGRAADAMADMLALLKDTRCPAGGWNGMPRDMDPTVDNCMTHGGCGCVYGEVIRKAA